jgi:hypothetical protein
MSQPLAGSQHPTTYIILFTARFSVFWRAATLETRRALSLLYYSFISMSMNVFPRNLFLIGPGGTAIPSSANSGAGKAVSSKR